MPALEAQLRDLEGKHTTHTISAFIRLLSPAILAGVSWGWFAADTTRDTTWAFWRDFEQVSGGCCEEANRPILPWDAGFEVVPKGGRTPMVLTCPLQWPEADNVSDNSISLI
jgi:hypothetical protein